MKWCPGGTSEGWCFQNHSKCRLTRKNLEIFWQISEECNLDAFTGRVLPTSASFSDCLASIRLFSILSGQSCLSRTWEKLPVYSPNWPPPWKCLVNGRRFVGVWRNLRACLAIITQSMSKELAIDCGKDKKAWNPSLWQKPPYPHWVKDMMSGTSECRCFKNHSKFSTRSKNLGSSHQISKKYHLVAFTGTALPTWAFCSGCLASIKLFSILSGQSRSNRTWKKRPIYSQSWPSPWKSLVKGQRLVHVWGKPRAGPVILYRASQRNLLFDCGEDKEAQNPLLW